MDPSMDPSLIPLDQSDNGPWMLKSIWILTGLSVAFLGLKMYLKLDRNHRLSWDDWVLVISWATLFIAAVVVTHNVRLGLGKHIYNVDPAFVPTIGLLGQIQLVFLVFGVAWSKTSWAMTLMPLAKGLLRYVLLFIIISINFFMTMSIILNFIQCSPSAKLWQPQLQGRCWRPEAVPIYSTFAGVYSGIMDIVLALIPWTFLMGLQLGKREKFGVAVAMSCGVFAGATAFVKSAHIMALGSKDPIHDTAGLVVWGGAEIAVTVIATSIPILRVFVKNVRTNMIANGRRHSDVPYNNLGSRKPSADAAMDRAQAAPRTGPTAGAAQDLDSGLGLSTNNDGDDGDDHDGSSLSLPIQSPNGVGGKPSMSVSYKDEEAGGHEMNRVRWR